MKEKFIFVGLILFPSFLFSCKGYTQETVEEYYTKKANVCKDKYLALIENYRGVLHNDYYPNMQKKNCTTFYKLYGEKYVGRCGGTVVPKQFIDFDSVLLAKVSFQEKFIAQYIIFKRCEDTTTRGMQMGNDGILRKLKACTFIHWFSNGGDICKSRDSLYDDLQNNYEAHHIQIQNDGIVISFYKNKKTGGEIIGFSIEEFVSNDKYPIELSIFITPTFIEN